MYCLLYHLPQVYTICVMTRSSMRVGTVPAFAYHHMHIAWHNDWHLMDVQEIVAE